MLLTVDIGTSTFKSALWDYEGNRLSYTSVGLSVKSVNGIIHEADPSEWLFAFRDCLAQLDNHDSAEAIIISGNGPSLVPVYGDPIIKNGLDISAYNARLWLDRRAVKYQNEVSDLMGGFVDACFFLPKILYIKNEEKEIYKKTKYFLGSPEYLAYALTGEAKSVFPCDGFDRWFWNDGILEKLKLDTAKFPVFIRPGEMFGITTEKAADYFGIQKKIPVISGGPDFFAAILGSGVTKPAQICDRSGSSEGINLCTQNYVNNERLMSYSHPIKPHWNLSGIINTTGKAIEWGCNLLGLSGFDDFIESSKKSKPGSNGLLFFPFLAGERASCLKKTSNALWRGINLSTGKEEFANSILESIGFAIKDIINVMEAAGERTDELRVTGKLAGCAVLNQIKADITGKRILEGVYKEAELLGLAIIGSCYMGKYSTYREASENIVKIEKEYTPKRDNKELYESIFMEYDNIEYGN
jgi:xylulokinase